METTDLAAQVAEFTIPGQLPSLNDVIAKNRTNRYVGAKLKRETQNRIRLAARSKRIKPFSGAVRLTVRFFEPNRKRDPDNVYSAIKFILDALVEEEIIQNDSQKFLRPKRPIEYEYDIDTSNPRVEVAIKEEIVHEELN